MLLAPLLLAIADVPADVATDDLGSPLILCLLVALLIALVGAAFVVAAVASGILLAIVGAVCIAIIVVASLLLAAAALNFALATVVWTRRPPVRRWISVGWWGTFTLATGPLAAVPFWWLHYLSKHARMSRQVRIH